MEWLGTKTRARQGRDIPNGASEQKAQASALAWPQVGLFAVQKGYELILSPAQKTMRVLVPEYPFQAQEQDLVKGTFILGRRGYGWSWARHDRFLTAVKEGDAVEIAKSISGPSDALWPTGKQRRLGYPLETGRRTEKIPGKITEKCTTIERIPGCNLWG